VGGSGAGTDFAIVSTAANSPTRSWFVAGPAAVSDRRLSLAQPISLQDGTNAVLEFAHRRGMENGFDGGVLEYSTDGGTVWADILAGSGGTPANAARFLQNGYVGTISSSWSSPIGGRQAWTGSTGTGFELTRVNLADFGGHNLLLRFRYASDSSLSSIGWWIDDIRISEGTTCQPQRADFIFADGFED
jgi:lysyl endopeptidase